MQVLVLKCPADFLEHGPTCVPKEGLNISGLTVIFSHVQCFTEICICLLFLNPTVFYYTEGLSLSGGPGHPVLP